MFAQFSENTAEIAPKIICVTSLVAPWAVMGAEEDVWANGQQQRLSIKSYSWSVGKTKGTQVSKLTVAWGEWRIGNKCREKYNFMVNQEIIWWIRDYFVILTVNNCHQDVLNCHCKFRQFGFSNWTISTTQTWWLSDVVKILNSVRYLTKLIAYEIIKKTLFSKREWINCVNNYVV